MIIIHNKEQKEKKKRKRGIFSYSEEGSHPDRMVLIFTLTRKFFVLTLRFSYWNECSHIERKVLTTSNKFLPFCPKRGRIFISFIAYCGKWELKNNYDNTHSMGSSIVSCQEVSLLRTGSTGESSEHTKTSWSCPYCLVLQPSLKPIHIY